MASHDPFVETSANVKHLKELLSELEGSVYQNVDGFAAKYFPQPPEVAYTQDRAFPPLVNLESLSDLLQWLNSLQRQDLASPKKFVEYSIKSRLGKSAGTSICLVRDPSSELKAISPDVAILVLGLFQNGTDTLLDDTSLLQFFDLAMTVFAAQADRRYLHAFRVSGTMMESWVFDRAGAYSGSSFDIVKEPDTYSNAIAGYLSMDADQLGLITVFGVEAVRPWGGYHTDGRLNLMNRWAVEKDSFVKQDYLVGPGTTCFKADDLLFRGRCVIKFSWTEGRTSNEPKFLLFANDRKVFGIPKLELYLPMEDIAHLRRELNFVYLSLSTLHVGPC